MIQIDTGRFWILLNESLGAAQHMNSGIWSWGSSVVLYLDHFPVLRFHKRRVHIACKINTGELLMIFAPARQNFLKLRSARKILRFNGSQKARSVARINTQRLTDGPESVRGIAVPLIASANGKTVIPSFFTERRHRFLENRFCWEVVDIRAFAVNNFAKNPFQRHVNRKGFKEIKAAILQNSTILSRLF